MLIGRLCLVLSWFPLGAFGSTTTNAAPAPGILTSKGKATAVPNPGAAYPQKQPGEIWIGLFGLDDDTRSSHWNMPTDLAKQLVLGTRETVVVFYWCGATPTDGEARIAELRNLWAESDATVGQRVHMSREYCNLLGYNKRMQDQWFPARDGSAFTGGGMALWGDGFAEFISGERKKLDAIVYDHYFGDWARFGLAKTQQLDMWDYQVNHVFRTSKWFAKNQPEIPAIMCFAHQFLMPDMAKVDDVHTRLMQLEMPNGEDFYLHGGPPHLISKPNRYYEKLPESPIVLSVSTFPKTKMSCTDCTELLPDFFGNGGSACEKIVFIGMGTQFFEQMKKPYQIDALMDQYLKIAAHFPNICFLWNTDLAELKKRVNHWKTSAHQQGSVDESWRVLTTKLQAAPASFDSRPLPNLEVSNSFPQRAMLASSKLTAFISHGGMNSVYEALEVGVPPLIITNRMNADAPASALACQELGVGLDLESLLGVSPRMGVPRYNWPGLEGMWYAWDSKNFEWPFGGEQGGTKGTDEERYAATMKQLDDKWEGLRTFFQGFIVDGQAESFSGQGFTLAALKQNIDTKLFGQPAPDGEQQYGYDETARRLLKMIESPAIAPAAPVRSRGGGAAPGTDKSGLSISSIITIVGGGVVVVVVLVVGGIFLLRGSSSDDDGTLDETAEKSD